MRKPTIGIFGHYGHENLGDETIIESCVQRIPESIPGVELRLYSARPDDSAARYGLPAYSIKRIPANALSPRAQIAREQAMEIDHTGKANSRKTDPNPVKRVLKRVPYLWRILKGVWQAPASLAELGRECRFLLKSRGPLRELDLLMITGSNQFLDNFGGPWAFPYTLLKWTWLARSVGVPVAFVSVGAGPLDASLSHAMIRAALRHSRYLSFRDEASRKLVDPADRFHGKVFPDLAFAVDSPAGTHASPRSSAPGPVVAINPMAVYDGRYWYIKDPLRYRNYVKKVTELVAYLLGKGWSPKLFATQVKDENVIRDIIDALIADGHDRHTVEALFERLDNVNALLSFLQSSDVVVPTRFHGTVLGLWAAKPTVGICYYRKAEDLLTEFGLSEYAFHIDSMTVPALCESVEHAWANRDEISGRIGKRVLEYRNLLLRQFAELADATDLYDPRHRPRSDASATGH